MALCTSRAGAEWRAAQPAGASFEPQVRSNRHAAQKILEGAGCPWCADPGRTAHAPGPASPAHLEDRLVALLSPSPLLPGHSRCELSAQVNRLPVKCPARFPADSPILH